MFWPWWSWWLFPLHGLFSLLVLVLIVFLIASIARRPYRYAGRPRSAALEMLEQRYARGEIQREEYLQKKQDLGG